MFWNTTVPLLSDFSLMRRRLPDILGWGKSWTEIPEAGFGFEESVTT